MSYFFKYGTLLFIFAILLSSPAISQIITPYYTSNKNPFVTIYGLPSPESAQIVATNHLTASVIMDYVNNSRWMKSDSEELFIDGETQTTTIRLRWGLSNKTEIGIDVPAIVHHSGFTDRLISKWHSLFHLPNNQRNLPYKTNNLLKYYYENNGNSQINIHKSSSGPGDIKLLAAWQVRDANNSTAGIALRAGLELPTGNSEKLFGSDSYDSFIYLTGQTPKLSSLPGLALYGSAGLLRMGKGEILPDKVNALLGFASIGINQRLTQKLCFKLQTDMHSSMFNSQIEALGDASTQLVIGGSAELFDKYFLDAALIENIFTDATPDVALHIAISRHY